MLLLSSLPWLPVLAWLELPLQARSCETAFVLCVSIYLNFHLNRLTLSVL